MAMKPAVQLHADTGDYVRYVLIPSGARANMTYADSTQKILGTDNFPSPDRLEWRLQSGTAASNPDKITLTVHDAEGKAMTDYLFVGDPGTDHPYAVTVQFVTAVRYDLTVDHMDGNNEVIEPLGQGRLEAPSTQMRQHILSVFLEN